MVQTIRLPLALAAAAIAVSTVQGAPPPEGVLVVVTKTRLYNNGNIPYFPHTDYTILGGPRNIVRYIRNALTPDDESPERIALVAGSYRVVAETSAFGTVNLPVTIEPLTRTVLDLDGGRVAPGNPPARPIRLANGDVIGWQTSQRIPVPCN